MNELKTVKLTGYKYQIHQELIKQDWEVVETGGKTDWWDDEHWKVVLRYDQAVSFYVCFIVDPLFSGNSVKEREVGEVLASTHFPLSWNDSEVAIASISMTKRKFNVKLKEFIRDLEAFKRSR